MGDTTEAQKKNRRLISNCIFLLTPWWKYGKPLIIIDLLTRVVVYPIRSIAAVTIAQAIIEAAQSGRGSRHVIAVAAVYISIVFVGWFVRAARERLYTSWKRTQITADIEREIYAQSMRTDFRYVDDPEYFDSYKMATEEYVGRSSRMYDSVMQILGESAGLIAILGLMATLEPVIIIIVAAGVALSAVFQARNNIINNKIWKNTTPMRRRMNYLTRLLYVKSANADLRSTNVRENILRRFDDAVVGRVGEVKKFMWKQFVNDIINISSGEIGTYIVMIYVALGLVSGRIESIGVFTTLIAASQSMSGHLSGISYFVTMLMENNLYAEKVRSFFELQSSIEPRDDDKPEGNAVPGGMFDLEMRNVSFSYPNSSFGLKNINIKISKGAKIAIVGENGAGKTTLSKLLLRLYDVNSGEILINGVSINNYDVRALRRRIGIAFQETQLYALTIAENIQVYNKADDGTLRGVLSTVGLDKELDKEVTREFHDDGIMLSGGEAQKLALARLLYGDFGLLLLDEPSSALDPIAEYRLTKALFDRARDATTIMIAHRLSTIRDADRIYLINDGCVTEEGTHDELMALKGKYHEMFTRQAENYIRQ